jgi:hypothetical protein
MSWWTELMYAISMEAKHRLPTMTELLAFEANCIKASSCFLSEGVNFYPWHIWPFNSSMLRLPDTSNIERRPNEKGPVSM